MQVVVEGEGPEWHTVYAWAFLEDVYRMRTAVMSGDNRAWHTARFMGACAGSLRNACEARFDGDFGRAPDQELMWFVTAARHLNAHGGQGGVLIELEELEVNWNSSTRSGWAKAPASITLDLAAPTSQLTDSRREMAMNYLQDHGGKMYSSLHAATRTVADWTGAVLDSDFDLLGTEDFGAVVVKIPLRNTLLRDKLIRAARGRGQFALPWAELERHSWSIQGHWAEPPETSPLDMWRPPKAST